MPIKVSELKPPLLDYYVAKGEGKIKDNAYSVQGIDGDVWWNPDGTCCGMGTYRPSTDWSQGGVILEREKIELVYDDYHKQWEATYDPKGGEGIFLYGPTMLIAGMRAYVQSKFGYDIEQTNST